MMFRLMAALVCAACASTMVMAQVQVEGEAVEFPAESAEGSATPTLTLTPGQKAWKEALEELAPLTPGQIGEVRRSDAALEEAATSREVPKHTRSDVLSVSIDPGASSPIIELMHGFVASIEVLDATGAPWPVAQATQGDSGAFNVAIVGAGSSVQTAGAGGAPVALAPSAESSVVTVAPKRKYAATNLMLVLQNSSRPVSLVLKAIEPSASSELRDRLTIVIQAEGPNARPAVARGYQHLDAGEDLRAALIGRPPAADAEEILGELPAGMRAWRRGTQLWVRTQDTLISPAPQQSVAGGDYRAYRLRYLPVIVMSQRGDLREVNLQQEAAP